MHTVLARTRTGTEVQRTLLEPYYTTKGHLLHLHIVYPSIGTGTTIKYWTLQQLPVIITLANIRFTNILTVKNPRAK